MVYLVPPGRGRWSALVLQWDTKWRDELPLPLDLKPGDLAPVLGSTYRVQSVRQEQQR
jgi:hypothetical protein